MCGIVGTIQKSDSDIRGLTSSMLSQIEHRGPDSTAMWISENVGLGNARLAIVGLSSLQNQPMTIGSHTLVFNGEIYNYKNVREELRSLGREFTDDSDTEVALQAFLEWGVDAFLRFNGMWAIAIYDSRNSKLYLSRDRLGVKPLYWTSSLKSFGFSSEIKGLLTLIPKKQANLSYFSQAIFSNESDQGEATPLCDVFQVAPGTMLTIDRDLSISIEDWWNFEPEDEMQNPREAAEQFREVFKDAVRIRIPTEVPYGFSLSGGLDSTAILGCAASNDFFHTEPTGIFNLSFSGGFMNESPLAKETTEAFNQKLEIFLAQPEKLLERIEGTVWSQEGIGWNASILAFDFYYSQLRKRGIKVVIEGHGADEILGGYPGMITEFLIQKFSARGIIENLALLKMANSSGNPEVGERQLKNSKEIISGFSRVYFNSKVYDLRLARNRYKSKSIGVFLEELYNYRLCTSEKNPFPKDNFKSILFRHAIHKTLPQVLRVFDRASMAHGVESRAPFLDYRLFELAMSMPDTFLLSKNYMKPVVRENLSGYIPNHILENKQKRGFGAPIKRILTSDSLRKYLLSSELRATYQSAQWIDDKELIKLLKKKETELSSPDLKAIWQAVTFAIWQKQFL